MVDYKKTSEILSAVTNLLGYTGISEKNQLDLTIVPSVRQWLLEVFFFFFFHFSFFFFLFSFFFFPFAYFSLNFQRNPFTQEECFRWAQRIEPEDWELAVIQMISTQTLLQAKIESVSRKEGEGGGGKGGEREGKEGGKGGERGGKGL